MGEGSDPKSPSSTSSVTNSPGGSRLKRLGSTFKKRLKNQKNRNSRGFLHRITKRGSGSRRVTEERKNSVFLNLVNYRNEGTLLVDPDEALDDQRTSGEYGDDDEDSKGDRASRRSSSGDKTEMQHDGVEGEEEDDFFDHLNEEKSNDAGDRKSRKNKKSSFKRGDQWRKSSDDGRNGVETTAFDLSEGGTSLKRTSTHATRSSKRSSGSRSSKRVSVRGLTREEGLVTREMAKNFSTRYSLRRTRAMTAEQVLGRHSVSIRSLVKLAKKGDVEKSVALVEYGYVDVNGICSEDKGKTALIAAAGMGRTATIVALYGLNADLEATDDRGDTALIKAASKGHVETVLTLLSCGSDSTLRNNAGESALIAAAQRIHTAKDKQEFEDYIEIVRAFFERARPDPKTGSIPDYDPKKDSKLIENETTLLLLDEWMKARLLRRELYLPSYKAFLSHGKNKFDLAEFFEKAHNRLDLTSWIKIIALLVFIVYDTYSPHFEDTYTTLAVYTFLYIVAYYG